MRIIMVALGITTDWLLIWPTSFIRGVDLVARPGDSDSLLQEKHGTGYAGVFL